MWSPDRRRLLAVLAAWPLSACGFAPAYGPGAPAAALRGRVEADAPTTRDAFNLVARFEERLGRPQAPAYRLGYRIETRRVDLAVNTAGSILRSTLTGTAEWRLTSISTGALVAEGRAESFTGSAATDATIAAQAAEEDAARRLMTILADQIVTEITAKIALAAPPA